MARFTRRLSNLIRYRETQTAYFTWLWARVRGRQPSITMPGGSRVTATGRFNDFCGMYVQHPGEDEFVTYRELLLGGGVFVDVGANMGLTSALAASAARLDRIIAFEPTHHYAAVWHENVARNGIENASLFQCVVSEQTGSFEFIVNPDAPMHNRLNLGAARNRYESFSGDQTRTEKVPSVTLDGVADMLGLNSIRMLKVDVEGAEPLVLRGARKLLERKAIDTMLLEFIPEFMLEMGVQPLDFVNFVQGFGYRFHRIREGGGIGEQMTTENLVKREFSGLNVIVLSPLHRAA
jgi:FkbM family methyltransferase